MSTSRWMELRADGQIGGMSVSTLSLPWLHPQSHVFCTFFGKKLQFHSPKPSYQSSPLLQGVDPEETEQGKTKLLSVSSSLSEEMRIFPSHSLHKVFPCSSCLLPCPAASIRDSLCCSVTVLDIWLCCCEHLSSYSQFQP